MLDSTVLECNPKPVFKVLSSSPQRKKFSVVNLEKVGQELSSDSTWCGLLTDEAFIVSLAVLCGDALPRNVLTDPCSLPAFFFLMLSYACSEGVMGMKCSLGFSTTIPEDTSLPPHKTRTTGAEGLPKEGRIQWWGPGRGST